MAIVDPAPLTKEAATKFMKDLQVLESSTVPTMQSDLQSIKDKIKAFEGVDPSKVMELVEKMRSGLDTVKKQIAANSKIRIPGLEDPSSTEKFSLVKAAVAIKTGKWERAGFEKEVLDSAREQVTKAGHVAGVDTQGGYFVPDQVIPDVIAAIYTQSAFIALDPDEGTTRVSVLDGLTGSPARIPKFDGGMLAYWIGEQMNYVESLTKVGQVSMMPKKLGVLTRITDEMQRFSGFGFENLMRNDMQRAAARMLDYAVAYGLGTENQPKGILQYALPTEGQPIYTYSAETKTNTYNNPVAGGVLNFDDIQNMIGILEDGNVEPNDTFSIISSPRFFRVLKQLKVQFYNGQTTGQSYLLGIPMLTNDRLKDILGYEFATTTQMATANLPGQSGGLTAAGGATQSYGDVIAGNMSEVIVGRWSGIEIEDDQGRGAGFINDQTYIKYRLYVDVGIRQPKALIACTDAKVR